MDNKTGLDFNEIIHGSTTPSMPKEANKETSQLHVLQMLNKIYDRL